VIVLHPGSRFLRIGKASDVSPITILNVVARKCKPPVPGSDQVERISRPRKDRRPSTESETEKNEDEYNISIKSDDPVRFILCVTIFHL
jgi:actin-related protein 8